MTQQEAMPGARSCDTLLNDYFSWGDQQDLQHGKALIDCSVAYIQRGTLVSFFSGTLEFSPGRVEVDFVATPPSFSGELIRRYSNRGDGESSPVDPYGGKEDGSPIDPVPLQHLPHTIRIAISGGTGPVMLLSPPTVSIEVVSPSNVQFSFQPQCVVGVSYGVGKALGMRPGGVLDPEALYVVSLGNQHYVANA